MKHLIKYCYSFFLFVPLLSVIILFLTNYFSCQKHQIYHLSGSSPQNGYISLSSKDVLHDLFEKDCVNCYKHDNNNSDLSYVKKDKYLSKFLHPVSSIIRVTPKTDVSVRKQAGNYHLPVAHVHFDTDHNDNKYLKLQIIDGYGKLIKNIYEIDGNTVKQHNKVINMDLPLYDSIQHLSQKQYREQQIHNHEYKIFLYNHDLHNSYLSDYVPLHKIGNLYCYRIGNNQYIDAKYIDKINGYSLIAQNIPCYSKLFNCYGCIANVVIGQKLAMQKHVFQKNANSYYLATAHLNSLDPSNSKYNPVTTAHLNDDHINGTVAYIPNIDTCSDVANVMPAVYLNSASHPFTLKNVFTNKQKAYFSNQINQKMEPSQELEYLPYMIGSMTLYGNKPVSKYFFDFKHSKNGQITQLVSNRLNYFAKPYSYYYDVRNTFADHFGFFVSDSYQNKYIASGNNAIKSKKDWAKFYNQSGYFMSYSYERNMHQLLKYLSPSFLYTFNPAYVTTNIYTDVSLTSEYGLYKQDDD